MDRRTSRTSPWLGQVLTGVITCSTMCWTWQPIRHLPMRNWLSPWFRMSSAGSMAWSWRLGRLARGKHTPYLAANRVESSITRVESCLAQCTKYLITSKKIRTMHSLESQYRSLKYIWRALLTYSSQIQARSLTSALLTEDTHPQCHQSGSQTTRSRRSLYSSRVDRTCKSERIQRPAYSCTAWHKFTSKQRNNCSSTSKKASSVVMWTRLEWTRTPVDLMLSWMSLLSSDGSRRSPR